MKTNLKLADAYYRLSVEEANGGESSFIANWNGAIMLTSFESKLSLIAI